MELILKGFDDWSIETGTNYNGRRWVDVYRRNTNNTEWESFGHFTDLNEALDVMLEAGLGMNEEQVYDYQERYDMGGVCYGASC
jgi:hypothetical protein